MYMCLDLELVEAYKYAFRDYITWNRYRPRKIYIFIERQPTEIIGLRSLSYLGVFVDYVFLNNSLQLVKF